MKWLPILFLFTSCGLEPIGVNIGQMTYNLAPDNFYNCPAEYNYYYNLYQVPDDKWHIAIVPHYNKATTQRKEEWIITFSAKKAY